MTPSKRSKTKQTSFYIYLLGWIDHGIFIADDIYTSGGKRALVRRKWERKERGEGN